MEIITLIIFCGILLASVVCKISLIYALLAGLLVFCIYAKLNSFSWKSIGKMIISGISTIRKILVIFLLIGVMTALWRDCGTIPVIICYASKLISPKIFILMVFLLNGLVSFLTGTSFGTAATMGVICMTMANAMGINPAFVGGAVLSGAFWGDRCAPLSTSALLVSELTKTSIFDNIKEMIKTAAIPTAVSCVIYTLLGFFSSHGEETIDLNALFSKDFKLSWIALLPAALILILSVFKVNVKIAMTVSVIAAALISIFVQHTGAIELLKLIIFGYKAPSADVGTMLNGGGFMSMLSVTLIVCISSSYAGIFQQTNLLLGIRKIIENTSNKLSKFSGIVLCSILTSAISFNQTLAIMLTHQLCKDVEKDKNKLAVDIEDSVVVISPLIPWSISCTVPLATVGAPIISACFAFYLMALPLYRLIQSFIKKGVEKTL